MQAQILIDLPNPTDYQQIPAPSDYDDLEILGLGTAALNDYAPGFFGNVIIRGAQLILKAGGGLPNSFQVFIENGGTLFLDNRDAAHSDRLNDWGFISLDAGTLAFDPGDFGFLTEKIGYLFLNSGANQIDLYLGSAAGGLLLAESLNNFLGTLNLRYLSPSGGAVPANVHFAVKDKGLLDFDAVGGILSRATVTHSNGTEVDWAEVWDAGNSVNFNPLQNYQTGPPADWEAQHNVLIDGGTATLVSDSGAAQVNSLKLANSGTLTLGGAGLQLDLLSGGLLSTGTNDQILGKGSIIGGEQWSPLYIHVHGSNLTVGGSITLGYDSSTPIIKTGAGTLRFTADARTVGSILNVYQGTVTLGKYNTFQEINIGDGVGTDILELPANYTNPIREPPEGWPLQVVLYGTPYPSNPNSGEFDSAILRFGGGTIQNFSSLTVVNRGTLDFVGGTVDAPNMLFLEGLFVGTVPFGGGGEVELIETDDRLFIRNWIDKQDFLLVRRSLDNIAMIDSAFLARINFEGYGDAHWVYWSDEYWEIKPMTADPEPATTGAILGVAGLGLVIWRRRRQTTKSKSRLTSG